ncbi:MAG: hypothetical protein HQK51_17765 [Oligoflexia bacterium]|nr:hypothetical protein [Oligoflexia bacterium]
MKKLLSAFASLLLTLNLAMAADCTSLFNGLFSYAQKATFGNCSPKFNAIYVKMSTNRSDSVYTSYAEGWLSGKVFGIALPGHPAAPSSLNGDATQQFSDRIRDGYKYTDLHAAPGTLIIPSKQNFSVWAQDSLAISIASNSTATLTLKSWGNGKISIPVTCDAGMMYGIKDGTMYTFSFKKKVYENTCIR